VNFNSPLIKDPFTVFLICDSNFSVYFIAISFSINGLKIIFLLFFSKSSQISGKLKHEFRDTQAIQYSVFVLLIVVIFTVLFYILGNFTPLFKVLFITLITVVIIASSIGFVFIPLYNRVSKSSSSLTAPVTTNPSRKRDDGSKSKSKN